MKINIFKPEKNNRHIIQITANMMTVAVVFIIASAFIAVGVASLRQEIKEIFQPKATYLVYHCKTKKKTERVPMIVDGTIKTEADIWALAADIEAAKDCKVIIEPGWRTIDGRKSKGEKE